MFPFTSIRSNIPVPRDPGSPAPLRRICGWWSPQRPAACQSAGRPRRRFSRAKRGLATAHPARGGQSVRFAAAVPPVVEENPTLRVNAVFAAGKFFQVLPDQSLSKNQPPKGGRGYLNFSRLCLVAASLNPKAVFAEGKLFHLPWNQWLSRHDPKNEGGVY